MSLCRLNISQIHKGLVKKDFSCQELVESYLKKINSENKKFFVFLDIFEKKALAWAKEIDEEIARAGKIPVLAGIPIAIKDNILIKGTKTTCASRMLENYIAPYDATVIEKLKKQKAVIIGKTNLDEFAMGASTENSAFFKTRNPIAPERVPGGSSGGSAAAVAAQMSVCALGSDTGGSIRQPSSFCGVVGLKPSYGAVSRYGLVAFASSLDQIGPIAKTVEDAEILFETIKGEDEKDSTSIETKPKKNKKISFKTLKIGVPKEYFVKGIDKGVRKIIEEALKKYEENGARIEEISLKYTKYVIPTYYLICTSEASANLARYDGIKYGFSESKEKSLMDVYLKTRERGFGSEVKTRIMLGTYALSSGYYDAYYLKAQKLRTLIREDFKRAFERVDVIFSPVAPSPAFKLGEKTKDRLSMYLCDIFTAGASLAGLPALSVPAGYISNLPVGLQIIGPYFEEKTIFETAKLIYN